jgi:hypothetical protein
VLQRQSRLGLVATLVFTIDDEDATFASAMTFAKPIAQTMWSGVAPVHRRAVRTLLARAVNTIRNA